MPRVQISLELKYHTCSNPWHRGRYSRGKSHYCL